MIRSSANTRTKTARPTWKFVLARGKEFFLWTTIKTSCLLTNPSHTGKTRLVSNEARHFQGAHPTLAIPGLGDSKWLLINFGPTLSFAQNHPSDLPLIKIPRECQFDSPRWHILRVIFQAPHGRKIVITRSHLFDEHYKIFKTEYWRQISQNELLQPRKYLNTKRIKTNAICLANFLTTSQASHPSRGSVQLPISELVCGFMTEIIF